MTILTCRLRFEEGYESLDSLDKSMDGLDVLLFTNSIDIFRGSILVLLSL